MTTSKKIADLLPVQRAQLKELLTSFHNQWSPGSLAGQVQKCASAIEKEPGFRQLAVVESVKVDLQNGWAMGKGRLIESYYELPLFDAGSVDPELLFVEYKSRRELSSEEVDSQSYQGRFPNQYEAFLVLANTLHNTETRATVAPQQSIVETNPPSGKHQDIQDLGMPAEFGRYKIVRQIGSGAMGSVHLAFDSQLDREVALKTPSFKGSNDEATVARFYQEAKSAAKLQHRNICPVYDVGQIDGRHFISMGFIKGKPLSDVIQQKKRPSEKQIALLFHRLAMALDEAHRENVIHRDLKPANVMIDSKGEPVVMDFGLARRIDSDIRMTKDGALMGTPAYMSPEQVSGNQNDIGKQSDIYSLGVMLYEVMTGKLPFNGTLGQVIGQILQDEPKQPSTINPSVSLPLETICLKMMAKEKSERYQSMDKVAKDIKRLVINNRTAQATQMRAANAAKQVPNDSNPEVLQTAGSSPTTLETENAVAPTVANKGWPKWILAAAGLAAILGSSALYFLMPVGDGKIRIETNVERLTNDFEVLIDGNKMALNQFIAIPAGMHDLSLKYSGELLHETNGEYAIENIERKFVVEVNGLKHSGSRIEIESGEVTAVSVSSLLRNRMSKARPGGLGGKALDKAKENRAKENRAKNEERRKTGEGQSNPRRFPSGSGAGKGPGKSTGKATGKGAARNNNSTKEK